MISIDIIQRLGGLQEQICLQHAPLRKALLCGSPADLEVIRATRYGFLELVLRSRAAKRKRHDEGVYRLLNRSLPARAERGWVGWGWPVWQTDVHCRRRGLAVMRRHTLCGRETSGRSCKQDTSNRCVHLLQRCPACCPQPHSSSSYPCCCPHGSCRCPVQCADEQARAPMGKHSRVRQRWAGGAFTLQTRRSKHDAQPLLCAGRFGQPPAEVPLQMPLRR